MPAINPAVWEFSAFTVPSTIRFWTMVSSPEMAEKRPTPVSDSTVVIFNPEIVCPCPSNIPINGVLLAVKLPDSLLPFPIGIQLPSSMTISALSS